LQIRRGPYVGIATRGEKTDTPMAESPKGNAPPARASLPPEARRALAEAEERRRQAEAVAAAKPQPKEVGGPKGPEPTRYGDWENKGIASDF
jgi:hypothetical protein